MGPVVLRPMILIDHNFYFFQTQYFLLTFSGSSDPFMKRSFPVCFLFKKLFSVPRKLRKFPGRSWDSRPPNRGFDRKDPGIRHLCLRWPQNSSKKYIIWKQLARKINWGSQCDFFCFFLYIPFLPSTIFFGAQIFAPKAHLRWEVAVCGT